MRARKLIRKYAKADINITPLIDVLLVLIVIFMVITPVTPAGLDTSIPQPPPPGSQKPNEDLILVSLDKDGGIHMNKEDIPFSALADRLSSVFKTRADRTIFVQADGDIEYDGVVQVIDVAKGAGAIRVGLVTDEVR